MCCIDKIFTDWCEIKFQSYFELIYTDQKQDLYLYFFAFDLIEITFIYYFKW